MTPSDPAAKLSCYFCGGESNQELARGACSTGEAQPPIVPLDSSPGFPFFGNAAFVPSRKDVQCRVLFGVCADCNLVHAHGIQELHERIKGSTSLRLCRIIDHIQKGGASA